MADTRPATGLLARSLPITVADMAYDRGGTLVLGGSWDQRAPLGPLRGDASLGLVAVVVWIDESGRVLDARALGEPLPGDVATVLSLSPSRDGGLWVARRGSCWMYPLEVGTCTERLDGGGAPDRLASVERDGEARVRALDDGGALVLTHRTEVEWGAGVAPYERHVVTLSRLDRDARVTWARGIPAYASPFGLEVAGSRASALVASERGTLQLVERSLDGAALREREAGRAPADAAMTLAPDGRVLVAGVRASPPDGGYSLAYVEPSPDGRESVVSPVGVYGAGPLYAPLIASSRDGRVFIAVAHEGAATVANAPSPTSHGLAVVEWRGVGRTRPIADLPLGVGHPMGVREAVAMTEAPDGRLAVATNAPRVGTRGSVDATIRWLRP